MPSSGALISSGSSRTSARRSAICFLELGPALLVLGARGVVLVAILLGARQVAFELATVDFHLIQRAALLGVVLAAEDLAGS